MTFARKSSLTVVTSLALVLASSALSLAKGVSSFPNIKIKNFGQMDERFYRGARPKESAIRLSPPSESRRSSI